MTQCAFRRVCTTNSLWHCQAPMGHDGDHVQPPNAIGVGPWILGWPGVVSASGAVAAADFTWVD